MGWTSLQLMAAFCWDAVILILICYTRLILKRCLLRQENLETSPSTASVTSEASSSKGGPDAGGLKRILYQPESNPEGRVGATETICEAPPQPVVAASAAAPSVKLPDAKRSDPLLVLALRKKVLTALFRSSNQSMGFLKPMYLILFVICDQ